MQAGVDGARDYGRRATWVLMYGRACLDTRGPCLLARLPTREFLNDWTRLAHARPLGERERLDERPPNFLRCVRSRCSLRVCMPIAACEEVCLYRVLPFVRRPIRSRDEAPARQALLRARESLPERANAWISSKRSCRSPCLREPLITCTACSDVSQIPVTWLALLRDPVLHALNAGTSCVCFVR